MAESNTRVRLAAAWIALLAPAVARADPATEATGGFQVVGSRATDELSVFALGNPAGLATGERKSRLDLMLGAGINSERVTDGADEVQRAEVAARLAGPAAAWQGLTLMLGQRDALRVAVPVQGGLAFAASAASGRDPFGFGHLAADVGLEVVWARRVAEGFAFGARVRPSHGIFVFPGGPGIALDRGSYGLFDYGIGGSFLFRAPAGERRELGVTYTPFNDQPDPLDLLGAFGISVLGSGGLGGYFFERRIEFTGGASQTFRATPAGTIVGLQGRWAREASFNLVAALDLTSAETDQLTRTDLAIPGVPAVEQSGLSYTLRRVRYTLAGRLPFGAHDSRRWVLGAGLAGASGRVEQYDFPVSHTVILGQQARHAVFTCALARERVGVWLLGVGFDAAGDRNEYSDPAGGSPPGVQTASAGTFRLGAERHLGARWAVRAGLAFRGESSDDEDPDTPAPGSPDNPKRSETSLTLGTGWQGERTTWDLLLAVRPRGQDPPPEPPRTAERAKIELKLAFSRVW